MILAASSTRAFNSSVVSNYGAIVQRGAKEETDARTFALFVDTSPRTTTLSSGKYFRCVKADCIEKPLTTHVVYIDIQLFEQFLGHPAITALAEMHTLQNAAHKFMIGYKCLELLHTDLEISATDVDTDS